MLVARLLGTLLIITLGVMLLMFLLTRQRKWLRYAGRVLLVGGLVTLVFIGVYFLERFLLIV